MHVELEVWVAARIVRRRSEVAGLRERGADQGAAVVEACVRDLQADLEVWRNQGSAARP